MNSAPSTPSMEPKQDHLLQKQDHMAPVTVHHNMEREPAPSYFGSEQSSGGSAKPGACLLRLRTLLVLASVLFTITI